MFSIHYVCPPWFYVTYFMQRFITASHASVFFEPPGTVQYVGSVLDDCYFMGAGRGNLSLGKVGGLSEMT